MKSRGSVLLEFLLGFPLVLLLILAVFQFAQMQAARLVVHYAAYCGARAALVHHADEAAEAAGRAAERACAWITLDDLPEGGAAGTPFEVPGWGAVPSSESTSRKTRASYSFADGVVTVTVTHDFSLVAPLVNEVIAGGLRLWSRDPEVPDAFRAYEADEAAATRPSLYPSLPIMATCKMSKPYTTVNHTVLPAP